MAEELDLDWSDVEVFFGPADSAYANKTAWRDSLPLRPHDRSAVAEAARAGTSWVSDLIGLQFTGASSSLRGLFWPMRAAAAGARAVLIEEAADRLGVAASSLSLEDHHVVGPNGARLSFGALAEGAARRTLPADPPLKERAEWSHIGRSLPRVDVPAKTDGTATFAFDIHQPEMLVAVVVQNPYLEAPLVRVDDALARAQPGVVDVIPFDQGVAVVADGFWRAQRAARLLAVEWGGPSYPPTTTAQFEALDALCQSGPYDRYREDGDAEGTLAAAKPHEARFTVPYLAHFTMEPLNAVAKVDGGRVDLWMGTQVQTPTQHQVAAALGVPVEAVHLHTTLLGGGFGRRGEVDFAVRAASIAKAMSPRPVQVIWPREQDTTHDFYRPGMVARYRGSLDAQGWPVALHARAASQDVMPQYVPRLGSLFPIADVTSGDGTRDQPYAIPHYLVEHADPGWALPVGPWRSVGYSSNGFMMESFLDELAHLGGKDPAAVRLHLLRHDPVATAVVEAAMAMSRWGTALPEGWGRGIAFQHAFGANSAQVAEISHSEAAGLKVERIFCAVDVGIAVDPRNLVSQMEGGIAFGLSALLLQEIRFEAGRVVQSNLHDYDVLRMHQMPDISVRILESGHAVGGAGEVGVGPVAAAVANALFDATGQRIRDLPLKNHVKVYG